MATSLTLAEFDCPTRGAPERKPFIGAEFIDDGPEEKLVFCCPECAEREFGAV